MAGGAFISMLKVAIFFVLIWGASKASRMIGISSIVLEITTGLIFSPTILGLMPKEYAECTFKLHHDCEDPHVVQHIQDHLQQCDYEEYMKKRNGVTLFPPAYEVTSSSHGDSSHGDDGHTTDDGAADHSTGGDHGSGDHASTNGGSSGSHTSTGDGHSDGHSDGSHSSTSGSDSHDSTSGSDSHDSTDGHSTGGDHTTGGHTSGGHSTDHSTGDDSTDSGHSTGHSTGEHTTDSGHSTDHSTGDHTTGGHSTDHSTGDHTTGGDSTGHSTDDHSTDSDTTNGHSTDHSAGGHSTDGHSTDHSTGEHSTDGHTTDGHSTDDHSTGHSTEDNSDGHSTDGHSSGHSTDHSAGGRRLGDPFAETRKRTMVPSTPLAMTPRRLSSDPKGQTKYADYQECLDKSCVLDVSHECQLTPNIFTFVGHTGVALMIFESGMHFDFEKAKKIGGWACVVAVIGTLLPLITGTILIVLLVPGSSLMKDGLSAGTSLAPTSVGIALKLLNEAKQLQKDFGQIIITAAFVDDILSLVLFNVLFSMADGELGVMTFLPACIGLILMALVIVYAATRADTDIEHLLTFMPKDPPKKKLSYQDEFLFFFMMIMVIVFGTVFFYTGTHLWGCFMAGMCLSKLHSAHHVWVKQTKRMTVWMIRIFFSCTVAFSIPVSSLLSIGAVWKGALMGIGPCIATKVLCAFFMGEMRFVVGWAMVGRAEFAYLIAQMAAASNMMTQEVFAVVIWSLLWATVFAPFLFRYVLKQFVQANEERRKKECAERGEEYHPEDEEANPDDEFRQSGPLPVLRELYKDFIPKKNYDGKNWGYSFLKHGPEGSGFYKDFIPQAEKGEKDAYVWVEDGANGPGFYIKEEFAEEENENYKTYKHASRKDVTMSHESHESNEKPASKPVMSAMEAPRSIEVVDKSDVHASFRAKESDEGSDGATERGSGFLCCLFFRKIIIM